MLTTYVWKKKQQMFNGCENVSTWYGHPAQSPFSSVIFHNVTVFQCYFLYFYTLFARNTEVNATLNNLFFLHEYKYLTNENVLRNVDFKLTMSAYM